MSQRCLEHLLGFRKEFAPYLVMSKIVRQMLQIKDMCLSKRRDLLLNHPALSITVYKRVNLFNQLVTAGFRIKNAVAMQFVINSRGDGPVIGKERRVG